jgi:hypothetical protein
MIWKNSTAAPGSTQHRLIVFAQHLLIWVIWYGIDSLVMLGYKQAFTPMHWLHLFYNNILPVFVFYGTAFLVKRWFDAQHLPQLCIPETGKGFWRQPSATWWVVSAILLSYVALSVFVDINFPIAKTFPLLDHIDKRLIRVLPYVAAAIIYGHYRSEEQWYDALLHEAYEQLSLMREQYFLHTTFAELLSSRREDAISDTLYQPAAWKNNMPAAPAKSPLVIIALHTMAWVAWFAFHSLSLIVYAPTFTALDWVLSLYDYCAIVLVFYGVVFFFKKYLLRQQGYSHTSIGTRLRQWLRVELFMALAILGSYIGLSVYLSQRFPYEGSPVVSSFTYAWRYFFYALPYVAIAALFSYFRTRAQVKRRRLDALNFQGERFAQTNGELFTINKRIKSLSGIN